MVNSQVTQEIVNMLKLDSNIESIPNAIAVVEVGMKTSKYGLSNQAVATNATSATILTTPTNQDVWISGFALSTIKDVTATSVAESITYVQGGVTKTLGTVASITLTVQNQSLSLQLKNPIKCDRGSIIAVTNSTATGNITTAGTIYYFIDEVM